MYASFSARALGRSIPATRSIDVARMAGFGGVDLLVRDLYESGVDPDSLCARLADRGLRGGAWPLPVRWRGDESIFRADLDALPALAGLAARLGLHRTGTWVLPETPGRPRAGVPETSYLESIARFHADRLGAIARILAGSGIRLGLEVLGVSSARTGLGVPFVTRLGDLGPRLGSILAEHANVGILVDAFHLAAAGEGIEAALVWGAERVVWVHVADVAAGAPNGRGGIRDELRALPGTTGRVDIGGVLRSLAAAGYDGPVTVETLSEPASMVGWADPDVAQAVADSLRPHWPGPSFSFSDVS